MESKDTISSCSKTKDVHAIKYKMSKAKERCMSYFRSLHSHFQVLLKEDLKGTRIEYGFKRAFMSLFDQDDDTFTSTMLLNVDQLQNQLDKEEFQEDESMTAFWVINRQFQKFIDSQFTLDYDSQMANKYFTEYTGIEVKQFRETLLQHMSNVKKSVAERTRHQRQYDRRDTSSRSGNDTDNDDAKIRPIYDEEPVAKVQLTDECNIFATRQQHTEQPEIINEGKVDQYTEECQSVAQFQKDFSRMEAHCIALELKYQNHALKSRQHGQIYNEASNKAKMKKEIDAFETINIELKHSVAILLKENKTLKKHYKDLYDSIKIMRSKAIEQTTSLLANNADLKAQIQEKVFAIAALKNELRKLKGNSVDIKFAKTSVLGKLVLQPLRNQSVVRQPNAFKSKRPKIQNHEVNSRAKVKSHKTRNNNKLVDQKSHIQKPNRRIFTGHIFSSNKSCVVYEKTSPRSCLRWKPTGRIIKTIGLRWIPTGKLLDSCTGKIDSEPSHGSKVDISKIYKCKQTLDLNASTSINVQKKQSIDLSAGTSYNVKKENIRVWLLKRMISQKSVLREIHTDQKTMMFEHNSLSLEPQCHMVSADNTSGLNPQRKGMCTLQCALSTKEEKSSCFRPFSSTFFIFSHARLVINSTWSLNVNEMVKLTPRYISSGLVQNSVSPSPCVSPSKKDYEILFQPLFDEYFNHPPRAVSPDPVAVAA
nr:hypothetical protein [Tanacetum cinerariifolium]